MRIYDIIEKKRDKKELSYDEIKFFINGYCRGEIKDYQASALLMAMFLNGMTPDETTNLTKIMADSGDKIDLSDIPGVKVDKHSTGGVGDKTTFIIAPIVAACGVPVAKMSGRGLGHTGGTIDKLESVPGLRTSLDMDEFTRNVKQIGIAIAGQTGNLVPADKKIYALRDVTATVNSIPLIASSIMSKKIASGADKIVLDVKCGNGAFMKNKQDAIKLSLCMVQIGEMVGRSTVAVITNMDEPLGNRVGNSLEVMEAIEVLKGGGSHDLKEISFFLAAKMLELAGVGDFGLCCQRVSESIVSKNALNKFIAFVKIQGGDTKVVDDYDIFPRPSVNYDFVSEGDGFISEIETELVGKISAVLGAGRLDKESKIDYSSGLIFYKKKGERVKKGDVIAKLFTNNEKCIEQARDYMMEAVKISSFEVDNGKLILAVVDKNGVHEHGENLHFKL